MKTIDYQVVPPGNIKGDISQTALTIFGTNGELQCTQVATRWHNKKKISSCQHATKKIQSGW